MRAVSFVEKLQFDFQGNICKNALVLGDVDNDQCNELVAGNMLGNLVIFKGRDTKPWAFAQDLGTITCLLVGDILNERKNCLVCISGEGWCHIFHLESDMPMEDGKRKIIPFHTQRIPANTKVALLADVDHDQCVELVLGLTDRVLRTYRWADLLQNSASEPKGKLVGLHKWDFADQIGSISLNITDDGNTSILVAQPGGKYIRLQCFGCGGTESDEEGETQNTSMLSKLTPEYHPLASSRMRNPDISSEIMGGIRGVTSTGEPTSSLIAVATLDGTLMLVEGDNILWSLQVDYQLFALTKLDLIGDNQEEVIACAWDGQTYIVNQQRQSVRFQFEEHVCSFAAGQFNLDSETARPCIVYATFSNKIFVYHSIKLSNIKTSSYLEVLAQNEDAKKMLEELGNDPEQTNNFYKWCLYGAPALLDEQLENHDKTN